MQWKSNQTIWHDDYDYDGDNQGWDDDLYNEDGTLKSAGESYGRAFDYTRKINNVGKSYVNSAVSASSKWMGRYANSDSTWYYNNSAQSDEQKLQREMSKELKSIARAVNAVRNVYGSAKEQNLKVKWSEGHESNSLVANNTIIVSPDPLHEDHTAKPDWSKDKRRDVVIGSALTVVGMKRMSTPMAVKKIITALQADSVKIQNATPLVGLEEDSIEIQNNDLVRALAINLWRAVEQDAARSEIMYEYRGSAPYFAANQLYNTDDKFRQEIQDIAAKYSGDLSGVDPSELSGISIEAAKLINWNINNSLIQEYQVQPDNNQFGEAVNEIMADLSQAVKSKSTTERWTACYNAGAKLSQLEPNQPAPDSPQPQQGDADGDGNDEQVAFGKPDNSKQPADTQPAPDAKTVPKKKIQDLLDKSLEDSFKEVPNGPRVGGEQDTENIDDDWADGLTEASTNVVFERSYSKDASGWAKQELQSLREKNRALFQRISKRLDPISEMQVLPEHGLRSGKLTTSKIWKVTTDAVDNDRVFQRKTINGVSRNLHIGILLDFSSSMCGNEDTVQRKIAVLLSDLLNRYENIKVEIYGHQGSESRNLVTKFEDELAVMNHRCRGGTDEGSAYAYCAKDIAQSADRKARKILFAIGDGHTNRDRVKNAVDLAKKVGVETVDILINEDPTHKEIAEKAYGEGQVVLVNPHSAELEFDILSTVTPWLTRLMERMRRQIL